MSPAPPLDPALVDAGARLLLGRAPTPAERAALAALPDAEVLRHHLLHSREFVARLPADLVRVPLNAPPPAIAWRPDPASEAALLDRVRGFWTHLGTIRPHWSVNARDEFLPERIAAHMEQFRASGEEDLRVLLATLARHGLRAGDFSHVCDYGCGVGRVTLPLAEHFGRVTACDVSVSHLGIARIALAERGHSGVLFSLVAGDTLGMAAGFDLWYSRLVLQHNPPPITARILARMFALLAPGGIAAFQLPTWFTGYRFDARDYLARPFDPAALEYHPFPQDAVFALAAAAGCVPLEVREDSAVWPPTTWISNAFLFRKA